MVSSPKSPILLPSTRCHSNIKEANIIIAPARYMASLQISKVSIIVKILRVIAKAHMQLQTGA
jgi:hypothetical protein